MIFRDSIASIDADILGMYTDESLTGSQETQER